MYSNQHLTTYQPLDMYMHHIATMRSDPTRLLDVQDVKDGVISEALSDITSSRHHYDHSQYVINLCKATILIIGINEYWYRDV